MSVSLQPFPQNSAPATEGGADPLAQIWYYLLRTFWQRQGGSGSVLPSVIVNPDMSPYLYSSDINGTLVVQGGTVSEISIVRGTSNIVTGLIQGPVPMLRGDTVAITYSIKPNITFLPAEFVQTAT
jgi:hypothetical protein